MTMSILSELNALQGNPAEYHTTPEDGLGTGFLWQRSMMFCQKTSHGTFCLKNCRGAAAISHNPMTSALIGWTAAKHGNQDVMRYTHILVIKHCYLYCLLCKRMIAIE